MRKTLSAVLSTLLVLAFTGSASAICVKAPEANLRSGPGTKYEKLWEVFQYMPFKKIEKRGKWYKVKDFTGDIYWVYGSLVTEKYKCAVVKGEKANIRKGPGTHYEQNEMSPALQYYSFKVLKVEGDWVKVKDEYGDEGWVYKPLLWLQ
jgi:SH3-like domain-containing protein